MYRTGWTHALLGMHSHRADQQRPSLQLHDRACPHLGGHRCWGKYNAELGVGLLGGWVDHHRDDRFVAVLLESLYDELPPVEA
jgi:hypothetical protein